MPLSYTLPVRSEFRKEDYVCRRPPGTSKNCDLSKTYSCKSCRLKKCEKLGMSKDTVPQKIRKWKSKIKKEERVTYPIIHPVTGKKTEWINIDPVISRSRKILEEFHTPSTSQLQSLNALQRMTASLKKLRSTQNFNPKFEEFLNFDDYFTHWEELMTRTAEWLMHSNQFLELPVQERISFFKIVWAVWRRFERHSYSAVVFGQRCIDEKLLLMSDEVATRIQCLPVDLTDLNENCKKGTGFEKFRNCVRKNLILYFDMVSRSCLEWEFTDMEINYALCQIVWNYASRKLLGQTLQAGDAFLAEISENLHDYYRNEMKLKNYATRLKVLMEMVNGVLKIQTEHEKVMDIVLLFDSFGCIFSEPKFFCV
ncbi:hypothetical protein CAEBREN_32262 [Caenorhabditis brenneri]|uniref:NR LBD domain-containing protein n=1 Tax=Caenorhabditis brenneri TaxID=135651 RepID=G0N367_CAEBE|nr:hypothetical protein CAEBREN_32262 [Caenorhabditis brenneri]